jgi:hypothetical protein
MYFIILKFCKRFFWGFSKKNELASAAAVANSLCVPMLTAGIQVLGLGL